ncbi:NAD-dependent epimerase [Campylobacter sp. RM6883]|uniref:NAD-dependent epimerase n=1 Tax=Campylobacter californiensis TaxID=1032243 RepID=UPI001451B837|nr:NAD-dependent epimerase [Campylobacter sp. RM6914]MBE2984201.1 NAD-dependent epimerase [Campylobacter sp. RM6883]MBE2995570.1 NAD-dependent epimerase [Campylobacter sp. RM6913]QCD51354.1 UDP-glucuronic acid epimerase [Campylobacter sp. RM6914]
MKILVTGTAGFIGFHLANALAKRGDEVVGYDNINDYYDVNLKLARLKNAGFDVSEIEERKLITSKTNANLKFIKADLADKEVLENLFKEYKFDCVVNLAAQAGVRYSLINPQAYIDSNITGFLNILECCRHNKTANLVYASSSSVYGLNENMPFSTHEAVNHPISLYAVTKKSNEMMAHTYSHLFGVPTTGLRFFTVYGPWGRPDMALFLFTEAALKGKSIDVFNHGKMKRDFTYVDDIVKGIIKCVDNPAKPNPKWNAKNPDPATSSAPFKVYNIGNNSPVELMDYIKAVEIRIGREIEKNFMPLQAGDVPATFADVSDLVEDFNYKPNTSVNDGVARFVEWYSEFYGVQI